MENIKMPFLPEETLRTQRVEIYLNDLKTRLKELRHQHDEVIQHSVDIIKEIDEVSSSLLLNQATDDQDTQITKIKKLIQGFEVSKDVSSCARTSSSPVGIESKVDIRKILDNFEKLNESHVLKESLVLFKRAKESFEKIDTFFDKMANTDGGNGNNNFNAGGVGVSSSLKHKINIFNGKTGVAVDNPSRYTSCCSSVMSLRDFRSTEEFPSLVPANLDSGVDNVNNSSEQGYEGDNDDSEYDLFASKKKKNKVSPNVS